MFKKENRFMTRKVADNMEFVLQVSIWEMIDSLEVEKDYLQVFRIVGTGEGCKIKHSQEVPEYKCEYESNIVTLEEGIEWKLFVIDSGDYSTMMFADEY